MINRFIIPIKNKFNLIEQISNKDIKKTITCVLYSHRDINKVKEYQGVKYE